MKTKIITMLAVSGAAALGVSACGSSDDSASSSSTGSSAASSAPAAVKPLASIPTLSGRSTQVALDADFVGALKTLKLAPAPIGTAKISSAGVASFPITGGNVTYYRPGSISPYVQGEVDHAGSGLSLTGGGKVVRLTNFVIDPGKSVLTGKVTVDGKTAAASAPLFFLDGRTLQPLKTGADGTAILQGTTVKLKAEAAQLLDTTFGTDALKAGLVIGVAKITVNTA
ncbi:hypothetical protein FSW04_17505 [Baekduia soli]|uniref:Lipoprotein n=1 Tax=Baekduia soli TaxID=496014 RepID=A0A5B8U7W0_9ACTN|nr:hypothetical protein [Baekduia soli]QEC49196.1 hypothetical protein FSW04_17505 [Baekduia soli]